MLDSIDSQFEALCSWADTRLDSLEKASLPEKTADRTLEREIADGAGADLGSLCREMGLSFDSAEENGNGEDK